MGYGKIPCCPEGVRAQKLRSQGLTYREICTQIKLRVPKGTLSYWVRNVTLPSEYYQKVYLLGRGNIQKAQLYNKQKLDIRLSELRAKNLHLVKDINLSVGKLLLATLYWCEGNKYPASRNLKFGNSDPAMIRFFLNLLRLCYPLDESKFRLTIQCRADQRTLFLTRFWEDVTQIPQSQHYQPRVDPRTNGKPTQKPFYKGVCVINYFDSNLLCELQFLGEYLGTDGAIQQVKKQIN